MGASRWSQQQSYIVFHQIVFVLTGLCTTLGVQWLFYVGAASSTSFLTQLSSYTGMLLVGLMIPWMLESKKPYEVLDQEADHDIGMRDIKSRCSQDTNDRGSGVSDGPIEQRNIMKLSVMDLLANSCSTLGFAVVGSGMYQVIYSSVVIWCAIMTYLFMDRSLSRFQWLAICGSSVGLAVSSLDSFQATGSSNANSPWLFFGTLVTLGGTFLYACCYVYSDYIFSKQVPPPLPARVCFYNGIYTSAMTIVWIAFYTIPRFDQLIKIRSDVSLSSILGMYAIVTVANATHSWNCYELIDRTGNVKTGILQGIRAILVYVLSHTMYCSIDSAQCFTVSKAMGSLMVIGSVLMFTVASKPSTRKAT